PDPAGAAPASDRAAPRHRAGLLRRVDAVGDRYAAGRAAGNGEDPSAARAGATAQPLGGRAAPRDMTHDEIQELAAVYDLGGLDGDDGARFEALLTSRDHEAVAAVRDFEATLVALAREAPEVPPPSVKAALMRRIDAEAQEAAPGLTVAPSRPRRS